MKLYIEDISSINIDNISTYKISSKTNKYIYTDDGIFKCLNNEIYRFSEIYDDDNINKITINNTSLICDNSKMHNLEKWYQISTSYKIENVDKILYELRPKALIKLFVEYINNNIVHIYFETNENINSINIKEDIDTFLSLLKIY